MYSPLAIELTQVFSAHLKKRLYRTGRPVSIRNLPASPNTGYCLYQFVPHFGQQLFKIAIAFVFRAVPDDLEKSAAFVKSAKSGLNIDFYLSDEQILMQVSYSLDQNSREREVNALVKAGRLMPDVLRFQILSFSESGRYLN